MKKIAFALLLIGATVTQTSSAALATPALIAADWKKLCVPCSDEFILIKEIHHQIELVQDDPCNTVELIVDISGVQSIMNVVNALKTYTYGPATVRLQFTDGIHEVPAIVRIRFIDVSKFDELKEIEDYFRELGCLYDASGFSIRDNEIVIEEPMLFDFESEEGEESETDTDSEHGWPDENSEGF